MAARSEGVRSPYSSFHSSEQEKAREQPGHQVAAVYNTHTHNSSLNQPRCAASSCLGTRDTLPLLEIHTIITKTVVLPSTCISEPQVLISAHNRFETRTVSVLPEQLRAIRHTRWPSGTYNIYNIYQLYPRNATAKRCVCRGALALCSHRCRSVLTHPQPSSPPSSPPCPSAGLRGRSIAPTAAQPLCSAATAGNSLGMLLARPAQNSDKQFAPLLFNSKTHCGGPATSGVSQKHHETGCAGANRVLLRAAGAYFGTESKQSPKHPCCPAGVVLHLQDLAGHRPNLL